MNASLSPTEIREVEALEKILAARRAYLASVTDLYDPILESAGVPYQRFAVPAAPNMPARRRYLNRLPEKAAG